MARLIKVTTIDSCAECKKDFSNYETCFYTWYENNVFCHDCKYLMNERVSEDYLDWKIRIFDDSPLT